MTTDEIVRKINALAKNTGEDKIAYAAIKAYNKGVPLAKIARVAQMKYPRLWYIVRKYSEK